MHQAGKSKTNKTPIGARFLTGAVAGALMLNAVSAVAQGALMQGHAAAPAAPAPPMPLDASAPGGASAPARALPAMPVPVPAPAPAAASGASGTSAASGASEAAASGASAASAASSASEAQVPEVPLPPEPPEPNLAQRTGMPPAGALAMRQAYAKEVNRRLTVPAVDQQAYGRLLQHRLAEEGHGDLANEYVVLVDRSANVQALFVFFRARPDDAWSMIGASPVSTGRPGTYDHFLTPLGVFQHMPGNMDFRAEGTLNEYQIRGYGARDMRIYDFGWAEGERGWGKGGKSPMRFQMHATDPEKLEPLLGMRHSKGCVRIPSTLNTFFDHHGVLDAQYEARAAEGQSMWILKASRKTTPWAGHYLVVIDTGRKSRPAWSPGPGKAVREHIPAGADTVD
ncbi:L,D-transpeptidase [Caballeronia sp. LZ035]|uniref:L,D-transpeptidase n=1 Tax=Caballeronia sp. LZ035 TaxID=3038568 RepID=UPI002855F433|nr:L,D-transpeptidase [Caballeronia sp. LZ035]MDR5762056.1 L,D-transpeptidase [Caballeronia sp. LZ035]